MLQELAYLSAALCIKRGEGPDKAYKLLNEAVEIHFGALKVSVLILTFEFMHMSIKKQLLFATSFRGHNKQMYIVTCMHVHISH